MTENEKLECAIHCMKAQAGIEVCEECNAYLMDSSTCEEVAKEGYKALEEVHEYRKLGTVEELKNQKHNLSVAYKIISDYQDIGTVEEIKAKLNSLELYRKE